jgi:hypothetical protein
VRFELGRFALSAFQAILDAASQRHLAGHRLTVALPRGIFLGLSETVLYKRNLDFKYLVPLSIFYAQQYSEGTNADNVLWALDLKVPVRRGLSICGELLVDDLQYERDEAAGPDRLGAYVTADALFMAGGREIEASCGYFYVDVYTYAHGDGTQYIAGDGNLTMNRMLGLTYRGPDSDRWFAKATVGMSARSSLSVECGRSRYGGSGSLLHYLRDWQPGMDNNPHFPSRPVMNVAYVIPSLRYDLNSGSYVSAGVWVRHRERAADRIDEYDYMGWLELLLDL